MRRTILTASAVTSTPIPSPGMMAILNGVLDTALHEATKKHEGHEPAVYTAFLRVFDDLRAFVLIRGRKMTSTHYSSHDDQRRTRGTRRENSFCSAVSALNVGPCSGVS